MILHVLNMAHKKTQFPGLVINAKNMAYISVSTVTSLFFWPIIQIPEDTPFFIAVYDEFKLLTWLSLHVRINTIIRISELKIASILFIYLQIQQSLI